MQNLPEDQRAHQDRSAVADELRAALVASLSEGARWVRGARRHRLSGRGGGTVTAEGSGDRRIEHFEIPRHDLAGVAAARRFVRGCLQRWDAVELSDTLEVIASEG
ncbi:hypothetical protein [Streptomyces sp. NPDC086777]|uniref:hypothetical protein n=1 Tax=Streptomyces sp. NPDC086777 TaxID=3154866 RepID=UPI00344F23F5